MGLCRRCKQWFRKVGRRDRVCKPCFKKTHPGGSTGTRQSHQWRRLIGLKV